MAEKRTKEQIDLENRQRSDLGMDLLPYEEESTTPEAAATPETPTAEIKPLDDDSVKEYLKAKGIEINSFEDLRKPVTEEDIKLSKEERENDKLAFGLKNKLFKKSEYEEFVTATKDPLSLVFEDFKADVLADDESLGEEEIQEMFDEEYHQNEKPESSKFKIGKKKVEVLAAKLMKEKFGKIYSLESEYEKDEKSKTDKQAFNKKIVSGAPAYKQTVKEILSEIRKITESIGDEGDEQTFEFEFPEESIKQLESQLLDENFVVSKIANGYTKDDIKEIALTVLQKQNQSAMVRKIAKDYASSILKQKNMGKLGIIPNRETVYGSQKDINENLAKFHEQLTGGIGEPATN